MKKITIELSEEHAEVLLDFMKEAKIEDTTDNRNIVGSLLLVNGGISIAVSAGILSAIQEKFPKSELL